MQTSISILRGKKVVFLWSIVSDAATILQLQSLERDTVCHSLWLCAAISLKIWLVYLRTQYLSMSLVIGDKMDHWDWDFLFAKDKVVSVIRYDYHWTDQLAERVQKAGLHPEFSQDRNRKLILARKQVILECFQVPHSPEKRIVIILLLFH